MGVRVTPLHTRSPLATLLLRLRGYTALKHAGHGSQCRLRARGPDVQEHISQFARTVRDVCVLATHFGHLFGAQVRTQRHPRHEYHVFRGTGAVLVGVSAQKGYRFRARILSHSVGPLVHHLQICQTLCLINFCSFVLYLFQLIHVIVATNVR